MNDIQRTALVTGANRGIGFAIAQGLAAQGLKVLLGARSAQAGEDAAAQIDGDVTAVALDVTNMEAINRVCSGHAIDILINNAGVLYQDPLLEKSEAFEDGINVMLRGPYYLIRATAPGMKKRGWGRIVNISSGWGSFNEGLGGPNGYGLAKAALNAMTLTLSRELPAAIKINTMCPGWVRTRMGGGGATLTPEQGADTAIWLALLPASGPSGGFFRGRKAIAW